MAQPLGQNVPLFCLACMGTNNIFDAEHVLVWWKFIYSECGERNIDILSFGGDGDTRITKAMKESTQLFTSKPDALYKQVPVCPKNSLDIPQSWNSWFLLNAVSNIYVQDVIHIATKLKSCLLKPSIILPVGPHYSASGNHVKMIRQKFEKYEHGLRECDVNTKTGKTLML